MYGERGVNLKVRTRELLWKPAGTRVRFVLVEHPTRGRITLMSTGLSLEVREIIRLYGLRFKIELGYKQASQVIGAFDYHFWMKDMKPLQRRNGNQYLHRESAHYRDQVRRKIYTYHVYLVIGIVAQGLLQYLSACHTQRVWQSFGSWLRTIRQGFAPSERVVAIALRNSLSEFLFVSSLTNNLAKFITERQDPSRADNIGVAA